MNRTKRSRSSTRARWKSSRGSWSMSTSKWGASSKPSSASVNSITPSSSLRRTTAPQAKAASPGTFNETYVLNGLQTDFDANWRAYPDWGRENTYPHYHAGWAMAGNTPFKYFKQSEHRGGQTDALVVHWPNGIKAKGEIRTQFHHIADIARQGSLRQRPQPTPVAGRLPRKSRTGSIATNAATCTRGICPSSSKTTAGSSPHSTCAPKNAKSFPAPFQVDNRTPPPSPLEK